MLRKIINKKSKGQAMAEYAILVFIVMSAFAGIMTPFCESLDEFVQVVYSIFISNYP